ncbi:hypothetical protein [Cellulosimicrobium cellulans]|uniref:hypothetical protein n=1 Tax=Cellulosimicrobium cellulans TaxID=1710 RepID=UPI0002D84B1D|nr:hypothetical protein [Cellulosimicrobium cellulans]
MTHPTPVLDPDRIYLAHDRWVCGEGRCAGMTAQHTGATTGGVRLRPVTVADVDDWEWAGLGTLTCECRRLTASRGPSNDVAIVRAA